ncbi:MAG: site-specific integrase [Ruminococcaceae bacterium]|nr:site-specific integrase [Oscillospiraceae bacterium]
MSKGENIFKRKDGRWEARYIKGYELSGKIKYGFCYGKTYKEAKEKVIKCKATVMDGKALPQTASRHRFGFYCDDWLRISKNKLKESTVIKYSTILERHIKPKLGGCYPLGITSGLIEAFAEELMEQDKLAPKSVKDILMVLHSILKYTAKQFPGTFPMIEVTYPREPKKEMRVLSKDEQRCFVEYLLADMDECKFGILLALFTGIRIGELCALRWEHVSLIDKTIKITSTMQRLKDISANGEAKTRIVINTPKSDSSIRTIPMTDFTAQLCCAITSRRSGAFVLTGTTYYMEPRALQYRLKKYTKECGLNGVHFHTLRHTFATRCVEVGFEIKSLSEILGHSSTTITLERYVHASLELKRSNMTKLSAVGI